MTRFETDSEKCGLAAHVFLWDCAQDRATLCSPPSTFAGRSRSLPSLSMSPRRRVGPRQVRAAPRPCGTGRSQAATTIVSGGVSLRRPDRCPAWHEGAIVATAFGRRLAAIGGRRRLTTVDRAPLLRVRSSRRPGMSGLSDAAGAGVRAKP